MDKRFGSLGRTDVRNGNKDVDGNKCQSHRRQPSRPVASSISIHRLNIIIARPPSRVHVARNVYANGQPASLRYPATITTSSPSPSTTPSPSLLLPQPPRPSSLRPVIERENSCPALRSPISGLISTARRHLSNGRRPRCLERGVQLCARSRIMRRTFRVSGEYFSFF